MDYAEAIKQDVQSILLTDNVEVTVVDHTQDKSIPIEMIRFGILIGKGKKGGLLFSADVHVSDLKTALNNCLTMIKSQLVLYAVSCIEQGHKARVNNVFMPEITHTIIFSDNNEAKIQTSALTSIVSVFNIFEGTYFNGDTIPKVAKTKPIKKVTKKTNAK